jgi:hypothetical protein
MSDLLKSLERWADKEHGLTQQGRNEMLALVRDVISAAESRVEEECPYEPCNCRLHEELAKLAARLGCCSRKHF